MKITWLFILLPILCFGQAGYVHPYNYYREKDEYRNQPQILTAWYEELQRDWDIEKIPCFDGSACDNGFLEGWGSWRLEETEVSRFVGEDKLVGIDIYGEFNHGKRQGRWSWKQYDENWQEVVRLKEGYYKNGKREGHWIQIMYGQDSIVGKYVNGLPEGIWTEWYRGVKVSQTNFMHGKPTGIWKKWHILTGKKWSEIKFNDGKPLDGIIIGRHENGEKESEGNVKDGKPDGIWTWWTEQGEVYRKGMYKDGKPNGRWAEAGQYEGEYVNGIREGNWTERETINLADYNNEEIVSRGSYLNGKREGLWIEWYSMTYSIEGSCEDCQKYSEGEYRNGFPIGVWTGWRTDGNKWYEKKYDDEGQLVKSWDQDEQSKRNENLKYSVWVALLVVLPIVLVIVAFRTKSRGIRILAIIGFVIFLGLWFLLAALLSLADGLIEWLFSIFG